MTNTSVGHDIPSEGKVAFKQPVKVHVRPVKEEKRVHEKMRVEAWGSEARQHDDRKPRIFTHRRLRSDHSFNRAIKIPTGSQTNLIEPQEAPTTARLTSE